jgi:mannose-6-phosphate isomerase-like protein (cupin superfamily)
MIQPKPLQPTILRAVEPRRLAEHPVPLKLSAAETGHAFSLAEVRTPPGASVPVQIRHFEEMTFYVLDGDYDFQVRDETVALGAGDLVFVPRGTPHAYRNGRPRAARMLVLATPGGVHERFLTSIGKPVAAAADRAPDGPPAPTTIRVRERATDGREPKTSVTRNGHDLGPPSAFYRLRYPNGRATPKRNGIDRPGPNLSPAEWSRALTPANGDELRPDASHGRERANDTNR